MVRSMAKRGMPKPFAILLATVMALYFVPFVGLTAANAVEVGGFEIEGNLVDDTVADPPIDWFDLGPGAAGFNTGVDNTTETGQDSTTFSGSSKEYVDAGKPGGWPSWTYGTGNATGKSDFGRWATYDFVDSSNHVWFFLAFDRKAGEGTAKYVFELNQVTQNPRTDPNPIRSQGDLRLVVWDQGNGLVTLTGDTHNDDVGLYRWVDADDQAPGGVAVDTDRDGEWVKITNGGVFAGASNIGETPITVPTWWTSGNVSGGLLDKDEFLEFGIDLTSFGAVLGCPSSGFSAVNARSITGTGGPGTLVDYLEAIPVTIPSNCANLVINKVDEDGDPLGGATFRIAPNPLPVGTPGRPSDNFLTIFDDSDGNTTKEGSTNYDDPDATAGRITLAAVVPDVEYTITEIAPPAGYIGETGSQTVIPEPFGEAQVTFTNTLGSVKFFKSYAGPNEDVPAGATFLLERDALDSEDPDNEFDDGSLTVQDNGTNDANSTLGVIKVNDLFTGDYRLTETNAPLGWIADGDTVLFTIPGANNTADVELINPTFTNPRATYPLTVRKVAESDNSVRIQGAVFDLYRETTGNSTLQLGTGGDTKVGSCTTLADGECSVTGLAWGEDYYWYEVSVPSPYNLPDDRIIGPIHLNAGGSSVPSGVAVFEDPRSAIVTNATNGALPAGQISDSATLSGIRSDAGGSITFRLWDNATCSGAAIFTSAPVAVSGPGTYGPVTTTVTNAGDYYWIASYSGDPATGTLGVSGACGDTGETSAVISAQPGITTIVTDFDVDLSSSPTQLTDTATLSGASANATGSITFRLYGPFDSDPGPGDCTADKLVGTVGSVEAFTGNGTYTSDPVTVTETGLYTWKATYTSGDDNNEDATHPCGEANETVDVNKAVPAVTTDAQQDEVRLGLLPTTLTDKATVTGATANATGTVAFSLYGPFVSDPGAGDCTAGKLVQTVGSVEVFSGNGTYTSLPVVVDEVGYYTWVAVYSGDGNNQSATHECGQAVETTLVQPAQPTITTQVPASTVTLGVDGTDLTDTATLTGGTATIGGEIEFVLYGPFSLVPGAQSCSEATVVDSANNPQSVAVDGNGDYVTPDPVRVTEAGYYTWVATYSGDNNNEPASHACGLVSETVQVLPRQPVVSTQISATSLVIGGQGSVTFSDQATLSEATRTAGGTITFRLFGPGATIAAACATTGAVQGAPVAVSGNGTYQGPTVSVSTPGFYSWVATYSGDANNLAASHACGLPSETVQVFAGSNPTLTKVADPPSGSIVQRGDTVTYTVTVGNTGDVAIEDGVVKDILPAYVTADQASVTASGGTFTAGGDRTVSAGTITWTVDLAPGATRTFTYKVTIDQDAPELASLVNTAQFLGLEARTTHQVPAGDIAVVKEVSPVAGGGVVVEFGDTLTYTLTVTASGQQNQSNVVVTDYVPGFDPARPGSGETTYVVGSATCVGIGTCTVTEPGADGLITWSLGSMAAGSTRQVTFQVTIDDVVGAPGEAVAVDILNAGAVRSTESGTKPSNEVVTPVTAVFPIKIENPPPEEPAVLPRTGSVVPVGPLVGTGLALLGLGLLLLAGSRRRGVHRRS